MVLKGLIFVGRMKLVSPAGLEPTRDSGGLPTITHNHLQHTPYTTQENR